MFLAALISSFAFAAQLPQIYNASTADYDLNPQPIIGIVSQPLDSSFVNDPRFEGTDSYILAAYVKFMEAAGARVIPLIVNEPEEVML